MGGFLGELLEKKSLYQLHRRADEIYVAHGAPDRVFGETSQELEDLSNRARLAGLELIPSRIRHLGTENCRVVLDRLRQSLMGRVETRTN